VSFVGFDQPNASVWLDHVLSLRYRARGQRTSRRSTWYPHSGAWAA